MINQEEAIPKLSNFPNRITLELTSRCNISCVFCPRKFMTKQQGDMDVTMVKRLLDEMADHLPVTLVPFFRGEPLLHPNYVEILRYAKKKGIGPIQLTSNGTLLDLAHAEELLDLEVDFLSFSLDTIDPKLYESTRRGSNYKKVVDNILQFLELKSRRGAKYPIIQVSAVETEKHKPGMKDFVRFWQSKVDFVRVYIEHTTGINPGKIDMQLPAFSKRLPCHKVFTDMVILWNGYVALCNHDWTREDNTIIGNVLESNIFNVWHSQSYQKIRENHTFDNLVEEQVCENCDHWRLSYLPDGYLGRMYAMEKQL